MQNYNSLTSEEARIILGKWTEAPHSWEYEHTRDAWIFVCRQCDAPLFTSGMKFDSGCGWPAFDDAIPGRVKRTLDRDGRRTEITCANCGGHLGHVFAWEKITPKNTRHCVNSLSMKFVKVPDSSSLRSEDLLGTDSPSENDKKEQNPQSLRDSSFQKELLPNYTKAYFWGGCFWCMDAVFTRLEWVLEVRSGYMGGRIPFPTYERICSWVSGYIEIVEVAYDPSILSYETLLDVFFSAHDPTSRDRQGNDSGEQYRSVIFGTEEELTRAKQYIKNLTEEKTFESPIVTELRAKEVFYIAEDYHQDYYANNPVQPYCSYVIDPKIAKIREKFWKYLKK